MHNDRRDDFPQIWIFLGLLLAVCSSVRGQPAAESSVADDAAASPSGVLVLQNGDFVWGRPVPSRQSDRLAWQTPLFREPVEFAIDAIRLMSFVAADLDVLLDRPLVRQPPRSNVFGRPLAETSDGGGNNGANEDAGMPRLQFVDGTTLRGDLVGLDAATVTVDSPRHGRLTISRDLILEVDGLADDATPLFDSGLARSMWGSLVFTNLGLEPWRMAGRRAQTQTPGANLFAQHAANGQIVADIRLSGRATPEFQLVLGTSNSVNDLKSSYSIETWGDRLVLHRQLEDELNWVTLRTMRADEHDWQLRLEVFLDYETQEISVYEAGRQLGKLQVAGPPLSGRGVVIRNRGVDLSVDGLQIRRWSGPPRASDQPVDRVVLIDRRWLDGTLVSLRPEDRTLTVETDSRSEPDESETERDRERDPANVREIALDEISRLQFRRTSSAFRSTEPSAKQRPASPTQLEVAYADGSMLRGAYHHVDDLGIWLLTSISAQPVRMGWQSLASVRLLQTDSAEASPAAVDSVIEASRSSLHGTIVREASTDGLRWRPRQALQPVTLAPREVAGLWLEPTRHEELPPDLVTLVSGDSIPCQVVALDEDSIQIRLPNGRPHRLAREVLKSIRSQPNERWVYAGPHRGERWASNHDHPQAWRLTEDGGLPLFPHVRLARELELPQHTRVTFDLRFHGDATFVIGYGADTLEHAVADTAEAARRIPRRAGDDEQRPDEALELSLSNVAGQLIAQSQRIRHGTAVAWRFRNARGPRGETRTTPISLDQRATVHIEWTLDQERQVYSVLANGAPLYRWTELTGFDGRFLSLGVRPASAPGSRVQRVVFGRSLAAAAAVDAPLATVYNLRFERWAPEMSYPERQRFLTRRLGANEAALRDVVRGVNGDRLRGQLVAIDEQTVTFQSRGNDLRLPRERIVEVISLTPLEPVDPDPNRPWTVQLAAGGLIRCSGLRTQERGLEVESKYAAALGIPWAEIAGVQYSTATSPPTRWANWVPLDPPELPAGDSEANQRPSRWLNQPLPEFRVSLLDGTHWSSRAALGKPMVIDFWASWCGPCLVSMPKLMQLEHEFSGKVEFLAINQLEDAAQIRDFLDARLWQLQVGLDPQGAVGRVLEIEGLPTIFVVDPQGIVRHVQLGATQDLDRQLREVLTRWLP